MLIEYENNAKQLYAENNPTTAIASRTRYNFAASRNPGKGLSLDIGTNYGHGLTDENRPDILLDMNRGFLTKRKGAVQANAVALPFKSNSISQITMFELIEHVSRESCLKILNEAKRVVSNNGQVILTTPNSGAYGKRFSSPDHLVEYTEEELRSFFAMAGFNVVEFLGQGFMKEGNILTKLIRFARDNKITSWIYYNIPLSLRNKLRVGIQKTVNVDEIRSPNNETIKNLVFILKSNKS